MAAALWGVGATRAGEWLFEVGKPDNRYAEFALAPRDYGRFLTDGFFVVGEADARRDWPYVHPGPGDAWAGGRPHTFTLLFGLQSTPAAGEGRLEVDLLDTHSQSPPRLRVEVNGQAFEQALPPGAGDASVNGQPSRGREHRFSLAFPARLLRLGDNEIRLTTLSGSWVLYDWLGVAVPAGAELATVKARTLLDDARSVRALVEQGGRLLQPVRVSLRHFGEDSEAWVSLSDGPSQTVRLARGENAVELLVPAVEQEEKRTVTLQAGDRVLATREVTLKPVRKLTVYLLPHSHTDIGYTEIQTAIEDRQVQNLVEGIAHARRTADYPAGARFVWNVEVLWAADLYLRRLNETQKADFLEAVKRGQVVLNGMYLNMLTGLCRPEELLRVFRYATQLADQTGVPIDSVMISDVPGYTWGTVPAMAQAGIRYFSTAPNYFDRIGTILREWENKPFWWAGPDGRTRVLVWIPFWGYAMSHRYGRLSAQLVEEFSEGLDQRGYPYDIAHLRWSGHGDNAVPDPVICDFVRDWNAQYAWPRFIISGTGEAFRALERRYGDRLPVVRGDWTPYWEDGAGSSALETAMNRHSSDRVAQAETLYALFRPQAYPARQFEDAWNSVLLFSEHTWGAHCSVWGPERPETREQWAIKRGYALDADRRSRELLRQAWPAPAAAAGDGPATSVDVVNTLGWSRTELVTLREDLAAGGDQVVDDRGRPVPSQRLTSGELVFLAREMAPFAGRRFARRVGAPRAGGRPATAAGTVLDNGRVRVRVDGQTGGIVELTGRGIQGNFVDLQEGGALNEYLYLVADNLADLQRNGPVTVRVGEPGPLVASLIVESAAPGCRHLTREIRIIAGLDAVEVINTLDKERIAGTDYRARESKESVSFGFPLGVPGGEMWLDLPLAWMRPEADQMPSACKNWFTVGRWAEVFNRDRGITWVTLDAPLLQVGGLTATLLNSQTNPDAWRQTVAPTQRLYSWAMNNHWGTNYRAYQDGVTVFRYVLRPHRGRADPAEATRFSTGYSQPLLPVRAQGAPPSGRPWLEVAPEDVIVTGVKPSDDGRAVILRLFGASERPQSASLEWGDGVRRRVRLSGTSERPGPALQGRIQVPPRGVVTVRAELE